MWYHILIYGMDINQIGMTMLPEVMDGKETTVLYLPKGCRKVRVEVFPYHVDRIVTMIKKNHQYL